MSALTNEAKREVEQRIRDGRKLHAIKYLCDTFSISLGDAKLLVDTVERDMTTSGSLPTDEVSLVNPEAQIERLLMANKKIEAVKYVHSTFNTGLKEALRRVEEVQRRMNPAMLPVRRGANGFKSFSVIFGLIGIVLLGVAGFIHYLQQQVIDRGISVTGVVVELRQGSEGVYAPVIAYAWNGQEHTYTSTTYTNPPAYQENEQVMLFLNPEDPTDIVIDSFSERWLAITIVGGLGIVFTFFFVLFFFISRKF